MGVNIYSLRIGETVDVLIHDRFFRLGLLSLKGKLTDFDLDIQRQTELEALIGMSGKSSLDSPEAVLLAAPLDFANGKGHPVLGWDRGRILTNDQDWSFLPFLGYAVRQKPDGWVMHSELDGDLKPMTGQQAVEKGLLTPEGRLALHVQPRVIECRGVRQVAPSFYAADCILTNGERHEIFLKSDKVSPMAEGFLGKSVDEVVLWTGQD